MAIGALLLAAIALSLSGFAGAVSDTLSPGETITELVEADDGDWIDYSWTSDSAVVFVLRDPNNVAQETSTATTDFGMYVAEMDGTYTLTWTNNGGSDVTINYEVDMIPFGNGEGFFDDIFRTILIVAVVIVVVVVVIVVLVVYFGTKKKKEAQQFAPPPMVAGPPGAPLTNCPRCGVPLDQSGAFCQKCGARVR